MLALIRRALIITEKRVVYVVSLTRIIRIDVASFAASPFSVLCHTVNKIKYGNYWRNKERKNEPSKKKESLPR